MIYRNDLFICMYFIVGDDYQIYNDGVGLNEYYSQQTLDPIMIQYIGSNKVFPNDPRCPGANLLECCCRQEFSLNKGPGFIGGVESSIASMEVFHLYQKFKDISKYISSENRSPMSKGLARYIIFLFTKYTKSLLLLKIVAICYDNFGSFRNNICIGGCPFASFCDSGICRCHEHFEERYGNCWIKLTDFTGVDWSSRLSTKFQPHSTCNTHHECINIDMNMICSKLTKNCVCRENMRWNEDVLECQVFIDVDCSEDIKNQSTNNTNKDILLLPSKSSSATLRKYKLWLRSRPISSLSPLVTLDQSNILSIDLRNVEQEAVQKIFCREISSISRRYRIFKRKRLMLKHSSKKSPSYIISSKTNQIVSNFVVMTLPAIAVKYF